MYLNLSPIWGVYPLIGLPGASHRGNSLPSLGCQVLVLGAAPPSFGYLMLAPKGGYLSYEVLAPRRLSSLLWATKCYPRREAPASSLGYQVLALRRRLSPLLWDTGCKPWERFFILWVLAQFWVLFIRAQ